MQVLPAFTNYKLQRHSFHGNKRTIDIHATFLRTLLSSLLASIFMFMGLLAFSFSELGLPGLPLEFGRSQLLLRVAGWAFMFYLPIFVVSAPLVPRDDFGSQLCFGFKLGNMEATYGKIGKSMGPQFPMFLVGFGLLGNLWESFQKGTLSVPTFLSPHFVRKNVTSTEFMLMNL